MMECVVPGAALLGRGALVVIAPGHDVVGAANAAFDEAGEQMPGLALLNKGCPGFLACLQLVLHGVPMGLPNGATNVE